MSDISKRCDESSMDHGGSWDPRDPVLTGMRVASFDAIQDMDRRCLLSRAVLKKRMLS